MRHIAPLIIGLTFICIAGFGFLRFCAPQIPNSLVYGLVGAALIAIGALGLMVTNRN